MFFTFNIPPKPGHDIIARQLDPYSFAEVRSGNVRMKDDFNVLNAIIPTGEITIAHRRVNVGDYVYYIIPDGDGVIHAYAKIEELHDGDVAYITGYSDAAEHGEYGSIYVDAFEAHLTADEFKRARAAGWPDPKIILDREFPDVGRIFQDRGLMDRES